ncbi:MAG: PAS domain S-box protein [Nitrospira sp.]
MYSLARFSLREMIECSAALRRLGRESATLREAADRVVRYLFGHLGDPATGRRDCVLVRCFKTCSYQSLDPDTQALAREKIGGMTPDPDTRCFTLIASAGLQPEWNRVENSRRYRAIPLVSPAFVRQLPMFSQLLHQFGVSLETAVSPERDFLVDLEETTYNVFFVPTAAGSPYVPVQDEFVRKHGIESVLCFGGLLSPKDLFAVILFCRIPVDRETANLCKSLALGVKVSLLPFAESPRTRAGQSPTVPPDGRTEEESAAVQLRQAPFMGVTEQLLEFYEDAVRAQAARISKATQDLRDRADALQRSDGAMQEQTQIVQSILRSMGDGVVVTDADGRLILANPAMENIIGLSPLETPPNDWPKRIGVFRGDGATPFPTSDWPLVRALRGERVDWAEMCIRPAAGELGRWVSVNAQAIKATDGRPRGAVAVFHDITWLKQAQQALYESEHRFRSLVEGAQDMIFTVSQAGLITSLNPAFETVTQWSRAQWIGEPLSSLLHPDDVSFCRDVIKAILERGTSLTCSMHLTVKAGGHVLGEFVGAPQIQNGRIVGVLGVVRDVTERRRIEDALRDSEERLRSIVQSTREAIVLVSALMRIAYWNKGAEAAFGYAAQDIVGLPISTVLPSRYHDLLQHSFQRARLLDRPSTAGSTLEMVGRRKDGSEFPMELSLAAWKGKTDLFFTLIIRDITERRRAEEELERLNRHHHLVLDSAGEGIYGTDREGRTTFINPAAAKMLGWEVEDLIGRPIHDLVHHSCADGSPLPSEACPIRAGLVEERIVHMDRDVFWRKDGSKFPVEYVSTSIRERGEVVGVVVVFKDTTERMRAEEQIQDSFKRLRTLSRRMEGIREEERTRIARELHDELGVGLTCLKIDLSRLGNLVGEKLGSREQPAADERIRSMKEQVDATIASVQRIVAELRPGVLDDLGLVAAIEWQCRDFQRRTGIVCRCSFSHEELKLEPEQATAVFRICQEALTNVVRHAGATSVLVELEEQEEAIRLVVADNGRGITEDRLSHPRSFGLQGMRERAGLLGGDLTIQAGSDGGTTIVLRLPRCTDGIGGERS